MLRFSDGSDIVYWGYSKVFNFNINRLKFVNACVAVQEQMIRATAMRILM
jgi:hypothetical protein